jgi:hypothetical protein
MNMSSLLLPNYASLSTFNLTELLDRVRGDQGLRGSSFLDDDDIINWANEGNDEIASRTGFYSPTTTLDIISGQEEYQVPTRCIRIDSVRYNNLLLHKTHIDTLNVASWFWTTATGLPYYWYSRGVGTIGLYPTPVSGGAALVSIEYTGLPPRATEPEDHYACVVGWQEILILYCMMTAEKDINGEGERRYPIYKRRWEEGVDEIQILVEEFQMGRIWSAGGYGSYDQISDPIFPFDQGIAIPGPII